MNNIANYWSKMALTRAPEDRRSQLMDEILHIAGSDTLHAAEFELARDKLCNILVTLGFEPTTGLRSISNGSSPSSSPRDAKSGGSKGVALLKMTGTPPTPTRRRTVTERPATPPPALISKRPDTPPPTLTTKRPETPPPGSSPRRPTITQQDIMVLIDANTEELFTPTVEAVCRLMRLLQSPEILIHPIKDQPESAIKALQSIESELLTLSSQLEKAKEGSLYCTLKRSLDDLAKLYESAKGEILLGTQIPTPAILTCADLGIFQLDQALARQLLGKTADGQPCRSKNTGTHLVVKHKSVFYKLANEHRGLDMGIEQFVKTILTKLFTQEAPTFLTPSTLLTLYNVNVIGAPKLVPQYINASLNGGNISLTDFLICKETTDKLLRTASATDVDPLKSAIRRWITGDFIKKTTADASSSIHEQVKSAQLQLSLANRSSADNCLLDFKQIKRMDSSNKLDAKFNSLLEEHGPEQFAKVSSFILTWPDLVAGFNLDEVFQWVPKLLKLTELFLNLTCNEIDSLLQKETAIAKLVDRLYHSLTHFWDKLNLRNALALAIGILIVGAEDGKADNFQIRFIRDEKTQEIIDFDIVLIDVGGEMLKPDIVTKPGNTSPRTSRRGDDEIRHDAGIKSIVLFLDVILNAPISACSLSQETPEEILLQSLAAIQSQQDSYLRLQRMETFESRPPEANSGMPIRFSDSDLPPLLKNIKRVQEYVKQHQATASFRDLFNDLFPALALAYEKAAHLFPNNPREAFLWLTKNDLKETPPIASTPLPQQPEEPSSSPRRFGSTESMLVALENALASHTDSTSLFDERKLSLTMALINLLKTVPWIHEGKATEQALSWLSPLATHFPHLKLLDCGLTLVDLDALLDLAIKRSQSNVVTSWLMTQGASVKQPPLFPEWLPSSSGRQSPEPTQSNSPRTPKGFSRRESFSKI